MFNRVQCHHGWLLVSLVPLLSAAGTAAAQTLSSGPHFIGPLATGAPPLPKGAGNIEPYFVNTHVRSVFDDNGDRHAQSSPPNLSAIIPMTYGLTDKLTLGATLRGQYDRGDNALAVGDTTVSAQYGLYDSTAENRLRLHASIRQTLDTGRYDELGHRDGTGSGARPTTLALGGQAYFLQGHLRARAGIGWQLPGSHAALRDRSVYGTGEGFVGRARLGSALTVTGSAEYSIAPQWTLVGEAMFERSEGTQVNGVDGQGRGVDLRGLNSWRASVLPAVQYHFSDRVGMIAGVQWAFAGRNTAAILAPQVAVNVAF